MNKIFTTTLCFILVFNFSYAQLRIDSDTIELRMPPSAIYEEADFYVYNDAPDGDGDTAITIERVMDTDCHMESTICDDFLCYGYDDHFINSRIPSNGKMLIKVSFEPDNKEGVCYQDFTIKSTTDTSNVIHFVVVGISDASLSTAKIQTNAFKVYPNPIVSGNLITVENNENASFNQIILTNIVGKVVYEGELNSKSVISTDGLSNGLYTLTAVHKDGSVHHQKVIVQ